MAWRAIVCAVALAACGRIGFSGEGNDAPATDGGSGDGLTPMLDCTSTHPGALLCSGFEQDDMGGWDYTVIDEGSVTLSTARAYRGAKSLEIQTTGADAYKYARWGKNYVLPQVSSGDIYLRGYYWMSSTTIVTHQLSIMVVGNAIDPFPSAFVMLAPAEINAVLTDAPTTTASFEFPRDRWACLLLHIAVGVSGTVEVFVDGTRVLSRNNFDTRVNGGYTNVEQGVHYATPEQSASHFWIDEVVLDTSPVTCD
ncbi:MAG: hypothetical protein ACKV2T_29135 [Kofleriaceae bacterium]